MYTRICPSCNQVVIHPFTPQGKHACSNAKLKGSVCKECHWKSINRNKKRFGSDNPFYGKHHTEEYKQRASLNNSGTNNARFGKKHSKETKRKIGAAQIGEKNHSFGTHMSDENKKKMSKRVSGSGNPMFGKPSPQGSGNGWKGWYNGKFFRSLRELSFMVEFDVKGTPFSSAEKKEFRVEYIDWAGKIRNYFPDFVSDKTVYECKPKRLWSTPLVKAKKEAAEKVFAAKGYSFVLIDCDILSKNKLAELVASGSVVFTERYQERYKKWL